MVTSGSQARLLEQVDAALEITQALRLPREVEAPLASLRRKLVGEDGAGPAVHRGQERSEEPADVCVAALAALRHELDLRLQEATSRRLLGRAYEHLELQGQKDPSFRREVEALRAELQLQVNDIVRGLERDVRSTGLREQPRGLLSRLQARDLVLERGAASTTITLDPAFLGLLDRVLLPAAQERLEGLVSDLNRRLEAVASAVAGKLGTSPLVLWSRPLDPEQLWAELGSRLELEVLHRSELPRRGVLQRLSEGRRPLYMALMMISLFGAPFGFRRGPVVAVLMAVLFLVGFLSTFRSWRTQEQQRLQREASEARARLLALVDRACDEFERAVLGKLSQHAQDAARGMTRAVDQRSRESAEARERRAGERRAALQQRQGLLSEVESQLRQAQQRLLGLERGAGEVR